MPTRGGVPALRELADFPHSITRDKRGLRYRGKVDRGQLFQCTTSRGPSLSKKAAGRRGQTLVRGALHILSGSPNSTIWAKVSLTRRPKPTENRKFRDWSRRHVRSELQWAGLVKACRPLPLKALIRFSWAQRPRASRRCKDRLGSPNELP